MKEFLRLLRRFVPPYKKYLIGALFLNLLSAILNIFSFALIIPILQILFKMDTKTYEFIPWDAVGVNLKDIAVNNFYYYVTELIASQGGSLTLLILGVFLAVMTLLKAFSYFASSAVMIPLRTGVVRDIRAQVYNKVLHLPLSFFSEERKGDIIARMSGDVTEVETSVTSSLDMLIKNPILIIAYFGTLIAISWQLTLFTLLVLPGMGWIMGTVGKKLKRQSLDAQAKWSDTMSQLEETLGGLRIIKAFIAENKMMERFNKCSNEYRDAINRVATRQALAHPMSEFLGTCVIVIVLWFGGTLILSNSATIDAPSFIYYLVILYSVINPLKEFSKAGYNIPKGLASMERIDKILFAENPIKEPALPKPLSSLNDKVEFKDISFSYDGSRQVLKHINLTVPKGKTIALVGQSGSGKSTLLNCLTGSDIPANDRLFDTLDTTTRLLTVSDTLDVVISDTVGFIRKIPHQLVEAFKATLEELEYADLLLQVIDISDPHWLEQAQIVDELVEELGAQQIPCLRVYNKSDRYFGDIRPHGEDSVNISAKTGEGVDELLARIDKLLDKGTRRVMIHLPYDKGGLLDMLYREAKVESVEYGETIDIVATCVPRVIGQVKDYIEGYREPKEDWEE